MDFEEILGPEPVIDHNLNNIIIVDGLPAVDTAKSEKLIAFVTKKFDEFGTIVKTNLPMEEGKGLGYMFIQYSADEEAQAALALDGKPMDKVHTFRVNAYSDIEKFSNVPDHYVSPSEDEISQPVPPLNDWLNDKGVRDQYVLRYFENEHHKTAVYWNDPIQRADAQGRELVYDGHRESQNGTHWVEREVQYSPSGAYLVTFHAQGIALWGGNKYSRIARFEKENIVRVSFSPCEQYLLTLNYVGGKGDNCYEGTLWNVASGNSLKRFQKLAISDFPFLQFSHDDTYITRVSAEGVAIITTETMKPVHTITGSNITNAVWHPKKNVLAYMVPPRTETQPGCIVIYDVDAKKNIREKHIFNIITCNLIWSNSGDYLYANNSTKKTKKTNAYGVTLFRMNVKDIPIEDVSFEQQPHTISIDLAKGYIAAVCHITNGRQPKVETIVYKVSNKDTKKHFTDTKLLGEGVADSYQLVWSPTGTNMIISHNEGSITCFQIYYADKNELSPVFEHVRGNSIQWDNSGRYFAVASTHPFKQTHDSYHQPWKDNLEDTCSIWSFKGILHHTFNISKLFQFHWRPRPQVLLSETEVEEIRKNLNKTYWSIFAEEDASHVRSKKSEANKLRVQVKQDWKDFKLKCEARRKEEEFDYNELCHTEEAGEAKILRYVKIVHKEK